MEGYCDDYEEKYPDAEEIDSTGIWDMPYSIEGIRTIIPGWNLLRTTLHMDE